MLLRRDEAALLIVDIQDRLLPAMAEAAAVVDNGVLLIRAASRLGVPVIVSQQYPHGLGPTVAAVADALPVDAEVVDKLSFSCLGEPGFAERFYRLRRRQAVVAGIEAHVCVLQTAEQLLAAGTDVFVVTDATSSRRPLSHQTAMARLQRAGAEIVTTEMVIFEWLAQAGTPEFKELSGLIK